jgi:phospholipid/cholesterol/gamma-HCH transport system ATP-binding protein
MENLVDIKDLSKSFGGKEVLKDVSLGLKQDENLVVLGRSGSGKSVLIKCIIGLIKPDSGSINVLGKDITALKDKDLNALRKEVGFLFQSGALYDSLSVKENLAFPLRIIDPKIKQDEVDERVDEALESVGLPETKDKKPAELSGGMRKRIGLARTIIVKPKIILYDEPTTGLDTHTSKEISELILKLKEKHRISSVIITHDIPCAKITANRVIILKDGASFREGTYEDVEKDDDEFVKSFFYTL